MRSSGVAGAIVTGIALAIVAAPGALADDEQFVYTLDSYGVEYPDIPTAIQTGHSVCQWLNADIDAATYAESVASYGYTMPEAGVVIKAAEDFICPGAWRDYNNRRLQDIQESQGLNRLNSAGALP